MKRRKKNIYFGRGPAPVPTKRERRRQRTAFQAGVKRKRAEFKSAREKEAGTLFKQLQRDAKPQRARRRKMTPADEAAWQEMLRKNPLRQFPGDLSGEEISALRKLVRKTTMATKRKRRKKKNSRKGTMPAGLRKYWAKKRAKKNPAKKRRRTKARTRKVKRVRRRKPVSTRVRNYRRPARKVRRRRARKSNPRRTVRIKAPVGLGPKGLQQFRRAIARASGLRTRIVPQ